MYFLGIKCLFFLSVTQQFTKAVDNRMKYILLWNYPHEHQIFRHGRGTTPFYAENFTHLNCYLTHDRNLLSSITDFDVVVFLYPEKVMSPKSLPERRSPHQKYVFATMESSHNYPICNSDYDDFFNWTWTYRFDSDAVWAYVSVYDVQGNEVGPKAEMHWITDMKPIDENMKIKLESKKKAAAWFVTHCHTLGLREEFVLKVSKYLDSYGLTLDVYGSCGMGFELSCPRERMMECQKKLEDDYYFYFSFENSISEDYVSDKLLLALTHNTVPVVYGGANYTRFMPSSVFLDGKALGARKLAKLMDEAINDTQKYYRFFSYKNHYRYNTKRNYCEICALLNDRKRVQNRTVYKNMKKWWNKGYECVNPEETFELLSRFTSAKPLHQ